MEFSFEAENWKFLPHYMLLLSPKSVEKRRKILGKMKEFDLICALAVWGEAGATRGGGGLDDNNLLQDEG